MICKPCRRREHETCKGGTWCDCQHKPDDFLSAIDRLSAQLQTAARVLPAGVQRLPVIDLRS